ncbi:tyrosine--tRNA ligase [Companilactobacillus pabuli]|jgi:tyrosyl-tRNA synthetase|uniref:Tyrosine--tRNA ligase n=1 Tax=Companilactobacillus pabuli TaxID=2714036 RepID=A0A7L7KXZ5_9LACO|nr:tyrosine--tRNA ligase [Companilactobacillus pabuli]AKP04068.1 tyrosine--tRNA ligase [Companilactobacillus farciminis]AKS52373.1 tyrosine--tRNA ligase [Companilactobacillus farciminis]MDG5113337.1 tyrosine--tRNA ligase [Companilactobacillus pabuli]QMT83864.1 tyrosine--tRNA ligase [Companilactobacillus pabuli]GAQ02384.1 tyrosyl-tRNA synthase [Companilactobacillus farciminis]
MNIIDELSWRGLINQQSDEEGLRKLVDEKAISLYCGMDPTGDSMHIGHLLPFMTLERFAKAGHHPYIVIGGATGSIGDPSGKKAERPMQTMDQVNHNVEALSNQANKIFSNFTMVNNYDWTHQIGILDFLRDYGKLFNVNTMLNKEIISSRLEVGISFTEFTYQILQSLDFLTLYRQHNVQLQVGGGDQWGNLTAGLDLIHKTEGQDAKVYALTIPLLLKADGTKFGKTAGGAVWLDPKKTSPYEFYQFWFNQDDKDVINLLKKFTFLSKEEINKLAEAVKTAPEKRLAQKTLAEEVTKFVHGEEALKTAEKITDVLFSGEIQELTTEEVAEAFHGVPSEEISSAPINLVDLLIAVNVDKSKRQAREDIQNGAIRINGERLTDTTTEIDPKDSFDGKYIVIRRGKKKYFLAKIN